MSKTTRDELLDIIRFTKLMGMMKETREALDEEAIVDQILKIIQDSQEPKWVKTGEVIEDCGIKYHVVEDANQQGEKTL